MARKPQIDAATSRPAVGLRAPAESSAPSPAGMTRYESIRKSPVPVLALGGELKSTFCLYAGREASLSEPLGDLTDPRTFRRYLSEIERASAAVGFAPQLVAHDLHPQYVSTCHARTLGMPTIAVQHHHAHIVSVMADWCLDKPVVGVCCDGVGYGTDGAAWGCEVLLCDAAGFERSGHLDYFPLVGGDAAATDTWRPAAAMVRQAHGEAWRSTAACTFKNMAENTLDAFEQQLGAGLNTPMTSSLGRVFDAVSFLLGLCDRNEHEGQAAIALDNAAADGMFDAYPYETTAAAGTIRMSLSPAIRSIIKDVKTRTHVSEISARFHETIARMLAATADLVCERGETSTVVLSGGCFANQRLSARVRELLERRHLKVFSPRRVSCGDAGIALGQAVAAAAMHERNGACA